MAQFELQGHRGARGLAPENTIEGFLATLAVGVSSIELDVAMTADGVVVLSHDPVLDPDLVRGADGSWINARGARIRDLTLADVGLYDVGRARPGSKVAQDHADQRSFDGARMPTLDAVFMATAHAATVILDVEIKTDPRDPDLTATPAEIADAVLASALRCNAMSRLAVRSFDWHGLFHLQTRSPQIPLGWLTEPDTQNPAWWGGFAVAGRSVPASVAAAAGGVRGACWAPYHEALDAAAIIEAHRLGLRVVPWTVNSAEDMVRLIGWGVDGLCTDRPDIARKVLREAGMPMPPSYPGP